MWNPIHDLVIVIADLGGGGAQRVLSIMARYWVQQGRSIAVITFSEKEDDFFPLPSEITRRVIGCSEDSGSILQAVIANFSRIRRLRAALKELAAPTALGFISTTNIILILASFGLKNRVVISERNDPSRQSLGRVWGLLRYWLYPVANKVTANSRGALENLASYVKRDKLALVPNPLQAPNFIEHVDLPRPVILAVGRLHHQKAYDILLKGFSLFADKYHNWRLVIIGSGDIRKELEDLSKTLGISTRIIWIGQISNPYSYYNAADIFALPSRYEGMPNALLEAMSSGLPVVVSDGSAGALEYVENGVSGLVVSAGIPEALSEAFVQLAGDPEMRTRIGSEARKRMSGLSIDQVGCIWDEALGWEK